MAACAPSKSVQDLGAAAQDQQQQSPAAYPTDALLGADESAVPLQPVPSLVSGAGHDALAMADLTKASSLLTPWQLAAKCSCSGWKGWDCGQAGCTAPTRHTGMKG